MKLMNKINSEADITENIKAGLNLQGTKGSECKVNNCKKKMQKVINKLQ